jgi:xylulokinase
MEGLAFEIKLNLEILEKAGYKINKLTAIGGGAKSSVLNQLRADIIDKPISTPDITEAGCRGVAMLAKAAHFSEDIHHIEKKWVRPASTFHPQNSNFYRGKFQQFKKIYHVLKQGIYI